MRKILVLMFILVGAMFLASCSLGSDDGKIPEDHVCEYTFYESHDPTCTEEGITIYRCEVCKDTYTEVTGEPWGHQPSEATCGSPIICLDCGEELGEAGECVVEYWDEYDATCSSNAYRCGYCVFCGTEYTEEIENSMLEHDYVFWSENYATCSSNASIVYYCSYGCPEPYIEELEGTKLEHSFTDSSIDPVITPATCTENRKEVHYCDYCYTEEYFVEVLDSALGHDEHTVKGRESSCDLVGWEEYVYCGRCDYNTYVEIEALSHDYINDYCGNCQYYRPTEGITYVKEYSEEHGCEVAYVTSINNVLDSKVIIAATYESAPVIGIELGTASSNAIIVDLVLPHTLEFIEGGAFSYCSNLKSVTFNSSVTFKQRKGADGRDYYAFSNCYLLDKVYVPDELTWCNMNMETYMRANINSYTPLLILDLYIDNVLVTDFVVPESVTKIGQNAFSSVNIKSIQLHNGITEVGEEAFAGSNVEEFIIPGSIEKIGDRAFYECHEVTNIVINEGVKEIGQYAFAVYYRGASKLETITLPSTLEVIDDFAFQNCDEIVEIHFPEALTSIGWSAFYDCMGLEKVYFGTNIQTIKELAFYGTSYMSEVHITDLEKWCLIDFEDSSLMGSSMGSALYLNGELIVDLVIPESITEIKPHTFNSLQQFESIVIHDDVTTIGEGAFAWCYGPRIGETYYSGVKVVVIGNGVRTIGDKAFENCQNLSSLTIGSSVVSIGKNAFADMNRLKTVFIPESVQTIGKNAFCGNYLNLSVLCEAETLPDGWNSQWTTATDITFGCSMVKTNSEYDYVVTPNGARIVSYKGNESVVEIPSAIDGVNVYALAGAFATNKTITKLVISDSVEVIESSALLGCTNLEEVVMGNSVTTIGAFAFYECSKLDNVKLPDSVTEIGDFSFYNCVSMKNFDFGNGVEVIGTYSLYNVKLDELVIPKSVKCIYSNAFTNDELIRYSKVYFKGSYEEWYSIEIYDEYAWNLGATLYIYSATDPSIDDPLGFYGDHWYYGPDGEIIIWGDGELFN